MSSFLPPKNLNWTLELWPVFCYEVTLCLYQQINLFIPCTITHHPLHYITILKNPQKVIVEQLPGLCLAFTSEWLLLCPSSSAWLSPDHRHKGVYCNANWHTEKLRLLGGLHGWAGQRVLVATEAEAMSQRGPQYPFKELGDGQSDTSHS